MARQNALSIKLANGTDAAQLQEIYGSVIENVNSQAVSIALKNKNLSGNPAAGSVEVKRMSNAVSVAYGTARTAGKGTAVKSAPVVINLDIDREIVEEIQAKDVAAFGVPSMLLRRAGNHIISMARELDTAFFKAAYAADGKVTTSATKVAEQAEAVILAIETTANDYVDGVTRDDIALIMTPAKASALRLEIDALPTTDNALSNGIVGRFHGVDVYVSNHLPKASTQVVDIMGMVYGSVAEPVLVTQQYTDEKIPLTNAHAIELFFNYGVKAVTPELIKYVGDLFVA